MKMRYLLLILSLSFFYSAFSQSTSKKAIPVYANEFTSVSLFFPSAIAKVIEPAVNYKFEYDVNSNFGVLKARKGTPSNLTIITTAGNVYSFALQYTVEVENFNFILTIDDALGSTTPIASSTGQNKPPGNDITPPEIINIDDTQVSDNSSEKDKPKDTFNTYSNEEVDNTTQNNTDVSNLEDEKNQDLYDVDKETYYRIFCENNYLQKTIIRRNFRQNKNIVVKLNNILTDREEVYFVLQIENKSNKEYNVNGLGFFIKKGKKKTPKILKPEYTFNLQKVIDAQSINEIVYVFKKFSLKNREEVFVVLDEIENNRLVSLPLDSKQVNFPTN